MTIDATDFTSWGDEYEPEEIQVLFSPNGEPTLKGKEGSYAVMQDGNYIIAKRDTRLVLLRIIEVIND